MTSDLVFKIDDCFDDPISIEGEGLKKLLIVVRLEDFTETEKSSLTGILKAINHDINTDAKVVIISSNLCNISMIDMESIKVISFGISPIDLGLSLPYPTFTPIYFESLIYINSEKISAVMEDIKKKQQLWECLKKVFQT